MDSIEVLIFNKCPGIIFWKRYINDIFFISSCSPTLILDKANECNQFIKFTLELPQNDGLPFLDTFVSNINQQFVFDLYIKLTHSDTVMFTI